MSLHSNSLEQMNVVLKCKDEHEGVHVTRKQCPWTRFSSFESSMSNEHIHSMLLIRFSSRGLYCMPVVELFSRSLRLSRIFTRLTVLFVLTDGRVKNGGCARKKWGDHCDGRHIHKKAWYGILIYAADRVRDRWQGRCSLPIPIYLSLTMDSISAAVLRGIPYRTPHVARL